MAYVLKVPRTGEHTLHECILPVGPKKKTRGASDVGPGSLWHCFTCNQLWITVDAGDGVSDWERITYEDVVEQGLLTRTLLEELDKRLGKS